MAPTLLAGDRLLVVRKSILAGRFPARGQIVVFTAGTEGRRGRRSRRKLVKRVAAIGGDGIVAVDHAAKGGAFNGRPGKAPPGEIFVMGDNRRDSRDSRHYGCIDNRQVTGRVLLIVWPLRRVRVVR
ncbi:signal peptidase I [Streptomyces atratus]|uniref:Signal peptidase I n=2 Tax=Streptomyces atratus TaxID=1893 RepID=A0A2Z5JLK9_STRAR|nr:signal peptidase I [Streptomyces atratus]